MYHSPFTAGLPEFKDGLCQEILAGGVKIASTPRYDPFPPTPLPDTKEFNGCAIGSTSGQGAANANRANLAPAECRIYPAAAGFDLVRLREILLRDSKLFWWSGDLEDEAAKAEDGISSHTKDEADASLSIVTDDKPLQEPVPRRTPLGDSESGVGRPWWH